LQYLSDNPCIDNALGQFKRLRHSVHPTEMQEFFVAEGL
jgi:hypothetical protein